MTVVASVLKQKGPEIISVPATATVPEIADIITARRIGAVLVLTSEGGLAGIVSERDVVKALAAHRAEMLTMTAEDIMTRSVTTARPNVTLDEALSIMDAGYFRHLPVVDDGKLLGIISIRDVVKAQLMMREHEVDSLKNYVSRVGAGGPP